MILLEVDKIVVLNFKVADIPCRDSANLVSAIMQKKKGVRKVFAFFCLPSVRICCFQAQGKNFANYKFGLMQGYGLYRLWNETAKPGDIANVDPTMTPL